ncbi:MAG TPA: hypothetical protein V6C81_28270 [Planktothrix sp.]
MTTTGSDYNAQAPPPNQNPTPPDASASDSDQLVKLALQEQKTGDQAGLNQTIIKLTALQQPAIGNASEATRLNKLGLQFLKSKDFQHAAQFFQAASEADPSGAMYLSNLGFALMNVGELQRAEAALHKSIALGPTRAVAWGDLGLTLAKQEDEDQAVSSFLVGYYVSNGETLSFLKSLSTDEDPAVRNAASLALTKVPSGNMLSTSQQNVKNQP